VLLLKIKLRWDVTPCWWPNGCLSAVYKQQCVIQRSTWIISALHGIHEGRYIIQHI